MLYFLSLILEIVKVEANHIRHKGKYFTDLIKSPLTSSVPRRRVRDTHDTVSRTYPVAIGEILFCVWKMTDFCFFRQTNMNSL